VAQLLDEVTQEVDETQNAEAVLEETQEVAAQPTDDLPEQYRGKTPAELVKMHQEAESRIGQQGEEVAS